MEQCTHSELVCEALRRYMNRIPIAELTAEEAAADREGHEAFKRGDFVTLDEVIHDMAPRRRRAGKKTAP